MHGRGKMGAAPVFDAAVLRLSFIFFFIIIYRFVPTWLQFAPIWVDLVRIESYWPN